MQRNTIYQFMKDPDNKAKLFIWMTRGMIITTFLITIGVIIFIINLLCKIKMRYLRFREIIQLF